MIKKKLKNLMVALVMLSILVQPLQTYAADAANYNEDSIDMADYYSDYHRAGYMNQCSYVDIKPSIAYINGAGKSVATTTVGKIVYVPSDTYVKVIWSMEGASAFACESLNIWQHDNDKDFKTVTSYNIGQTNPYGLRGTASDMVGDMVTSKAKTGWTQTYSISEYNAIKFLCASPQIEGVEGESAAVGASMGNVTQYYYYKNKVEVKIDNNPPVVDAKLSTKDVNGYYASGTKATFTASDADSGIANFTVAGVGRTSPYEMTLAKGKNDITYAATDNAGKNSGDKTLTANVDGTAPAISATPSQSETIPGWYKGDTSVTFNSSDSESGLKSFKVSDSDVSNGSKIDVPEGTTTYAYKASDNVGNEATEQSITLNVDKTAPTASIIGTETTWTNQDIELNISGKDQYSGLVSMIVEYSADNSNWENYAVKEYDKTTESKYENIQATKNGYYRLKTTDAVGYVTTSNELISITKIDKDKPTIIAVVTGDEGVPIDKWYKKSAKINIVASDTGVSGLKQLYYGDKITTENSVTLPTLVENRNIFTYSAVDNAGNTTGDLQTDVYVDASAPTDLSWTNNQEAWTNKDITVTMNAKDIYSGLKKFVVQKQNETTKDWEDYTETQAAYETVLTTKTALIKENGTYRFKAIDRVGYEQIVGNNFEIGMIDKEKPVITPTEIGTVSDNGWYKDKVTLKLHVKDYGLSGLKNIYVKVGNAKTNKEFELPNPMVYTHSELLEEEGVTTVDYNALDYAGNYSDNGKSILKIDQTTPTNVTASADTDKWSNTSIPLSAGAMDTMSGLSKIIVQKYDSGAWSDYMTQNYNGEATTQTTTFDIGENGIYRVKVIDKVGFEMTSDVSMGGKEITDPKDDDPKPGIIIIKKIDKTKPTIAAEINNIGDYKDVSNGWYREDVSLKLKAEDDASGVGSITCNTDVSENTSKSKTYEKDYIPFQSGVNTFKYIATDVAGNKSDEGTTELNIDSISPVNLALEKITVGWVNKATGVTIKCNGQDAESGLLKFVLERSTDGVSNWTDKVTYNYMGETTKQEVDMITDENGYYRLAVYDRVFHKSVTSDIIQVDNVDETIPDGASLTINPDTTEWVNEPTGVDLTATGQDVNSGISELSVLQKNDTTLGYEPIYTEDFNGETTLLDTEYLTHINGKYKSSALDAVGNSNTMRDEDALEVPNIDPVDPTLTVKADALVWASAESGYPIYAYAKDEESGLSNIKLQSYDKETDTWSDTNISYTIADYVVGEEKLSTYEGNTIQNIVNTVKLGFNKTFFKQETVQVSQFKESGTNQMVKAVFKVLKNGTYRVVTDDIVANTTSSEAVVVTTMDFEKPTIMVEGNPTDWTNQTATIKVTAKDTECKIAKMTLNGETVDFKEKEKAFFFVFDVEKNADYVVAAYDQAGNNISQEVKVTKIDKEKPYLTSSIAEWNDGSAKASLDLYDSLSGVKSAYLNEVYIEIPDAMHTSYSKDIRAEVSYYVTITDYAGNSVIQSISDNKALTKIKVTTPPEKTKYQAKDKFNKNGMVVTAYYTDGSTKVVSDYVILNGDSMAVKQDKIEVEYTERGITKDDNTPVSVATTSTNPSPSEPETPSTPVTPTKPVVPVKPVKPTVPVKPVTPSEETVEPIVEVTESEKPEIVENKVPEVEQATPALEKENSKLLPVIIGGAATGAGLMFLFFFIMFTNVKVYSMNEKGDYKLIGRTRARIKGEKIFVKTNAPMIILAVSGDFKFVFSKGYAKTHGDSNVLVRIEKCEYDKYLPEGEDTIFVEYEG